MGAFTLRLVFTADNHIDHGRWGDRRRSGPVDSAWVSAARCFEAAATTALNNDAGLVVAGDLFLHGNPLPEAVELVADQVRRVIAAGLPVVMMPGNHDQDEIPVDQRLVVERFADLGARVISDPGVVILDDGTQIAGLPWLWRARMVSELGLGRATGDEIDDAIADEMVHHIDQLAEQVDPGRGPCVLAGHAVLSTATFSSGRRASELALRRHLREPVLGIDDVTDGPWDLAVFGHIHAQQSFVDGRVWIPGSADRIDFGDEPHRKGVLLFDPDAGTTVAVDTPARVMLTVRRDADLERLDQGVIVRADLPAGDDEVPEAWRTAIADAGALLVSTRRLAPTPSPAAPAEPDPAGAGVAGPMDAVRVWGQRRGLDDGTIDRLADTFDQLERERAA